MTTADWQPGRARTLDLVRGKVVGLADVGVVVKPWRAERVTIPYSEILTAERRRSRRGGLELHTQGGMAPLRVRFRRADQEIIERGLRFVGVRVVDCWGAIIAPTLLDFEEELAREPPEMRQLSDNA